MTIDQAAIAGLRATLAADDYELEVREVDAVVEARITAGPNACADCLVPKPIMRGILGGALGVPEVAIKLVYPGDM